jgi:hypothetical protein
MLFLDMISDKAKLTLTLPWTKNAKGREINVKVIWVLHKIHAFKDLHDVILEENLKDQNLYLKKGSKPQVQVDSISYFYGWLQLRIVPESSLL